MANGFEMYEEYKKKKNQTPTIKVPTPVVPLPVVTPEAVYKQSNNTPSVKVPGGSLPNALDAAKQVIAKQQTTRQMGIGFNQPTVKPQPLPYANKVAQTLPSADQRKVQEKAFISRVLTKNMTPAEQRQQNLANIKAEGQRTVDNINKKLERVDAALKSNNWMGKISATGDALINNAVKGAQERVAAYDNSPAFGTKEYAEWTMKNRGRITDPSIDRLIVNTAKKFDIDPTQYSPATQEFLKDEQEARERLMDGLSDSEKTVAEVAVAIGDVLQNKMIEATTGVPYKAIMATTGGTEAMQRKLSEGKSAAEAGLYGTGSAAISAGIESLGGIGGGVAGTTTGKLIMKKLPEKVAAYLFNLADSALVRMGISAGSESFEEAAEYVAQWAWESLNEGKVMPFSWDELKHNVKIGGWTGGAFEGVNIAVNGKSQLNPDDYITEDSYLPNRGENEASARMAGQLDRVYGTNKLEGKAVLGEGKTVPTDASRQGQQTTGNEVEKPVEANIEAVASNEQGVDFKAAQFEIIEKNNPAPNSYQTWIRKAEDIKTFEETLQDSDYEGWEESGFDPSYGADIAQQALQTGEITVYSSYPIEQGVFVTPSKMEAESYSGNGQIYSKTVPLEDVAWIDPTQGQYAKVETDEQAANSPVQAVLPKGKEIAPVSDNTSDGYENRVNELRESIKDLRRNRHKKVGGYSVGMYTGNGSEGITISIKTPDGEIIKDFVEGGEYWTNSQLQHEIASRIAEAEGYSAEEKQPAQPALPYNPNVPKPIPQNPAQGKFGEPMGIVANPEAVARAQERREFFQPKPNPEGNRNIEGSVLDNLGQGQAAFATLDNLLAQSKADAAKKPGAKEGIANVLTQRPKKFAKDNLEEQIDKIARKVVDSGRTIDTIGKAVDDKVLYPLYNNAKQSRQAAEYMIGEAQTDINGNRVGESLVSIFDPIKAQGEDYFRDFSTYLYHLHNVDRMSLETNGAQVYQDAIMQLEAENPMLQNATREEVEALASGNSDYREAAIEWLQLDDSLNDLHNKPVFGESVTAEDSRKAAAELARKNPEFAELAERVYAYNRNLMKYRVDAGLVSQKQADIMNTLYPHYVPTFRDTSSTTGMKISGNQAKVARTVRSATGSNLDLLRIDDSMAEQTMQTVRAAKQNLLGARLLEDALKHQDKVGRHVRSVIDRYNSYDMDEPPQLGNDITIYVGGKPVSMQADDGVMEAFQSIQPRKGERIAGLEAVAKANNTFKRLVTGANPTFLLKNFARDLQDAGLYSGSLIDFAKNYPKAWQEMATGGELWQLYKSQGGTGSSYFDYEKGLKIEGKKNIFDRVENLNMMVEQAPRFAEFVSVLEKEGRTYEGIQKAMLAAADVTVNFGRGGSATQFLNRTFVPFLNPAVQGADKLVRRFSETKGAKEWVGLVGRLALMGVAPALLNELLYDDDEEYQMLNDRDKENNYVFPIGDGVWAKIPKGRALSVFGSAAQRTARFLKGDKDAFNGFIQRAYDQVGVPNPLTNNIFSQVLNADLLDPESPGKTWYGSDIEPQRLQGLPPAERYDEKTDELSKWLGKQLNISPKKVNYLLDNYSGVIGDFLLPLSTPQAERNPFAAAFTIDSVTSNKLSEEFYTKLDELEQAKNSKTPTAGAAAAYRYMNGVSSEVSANNKKIREIQNDKSLTDKEKLEQVRKIRNTNNKLLKDAVDNLPGYMETASKSGVVSGKALDKVYLQTNYKQFGAEYALKKYDSAVYEKAKLANTRGISYEDYYKYKFSVDANNDGTVTQEEAKKQLDSMNLPNYQKAYMWLQQNKSWEKKNPYK